ncbi:hypothetical protein DFO47_1213, partial [Arthrobacter sp. AG258]|uniref:CPBP family intramembrane glutamic endopeptidase n=1 Tax=Arthrobacter sp. AG258 TaxID=2183899 RepID=UPI00105D0F20
MTHTQPMPHTHLITRPRPPYTAFALTGLAAALTLLAALLIGWVAPGLEATQQRFVAVLVMAAVAAITVAVTRRDLLTSGRLHPVLLVIPLLLALAPFAPGLKDMGLEAGSTLVIGYLATGIYEELWFRGLVLDTLASSSPTKAALLSSGLFGLIHLTNIAFGANPAITAAQVIGAACFGVGMAALRLRGVTLWPLIIIHAVTDIALQTGDITSTWRWTLMISSDIILLTYGL